MAIPNLNDPRRFELEWERDPKGMTRDEYLSMRAQHVYADRREASDRWFRMNEFRRDDFPDFEHYFQIVRLENDQTRQITGQIAYVDDWSLLG